LPGLKDFASQTAECFEFLKCVNPNQLSWTLVWDLLANARRRAELEMKYEDALVRCYSAIEKAAKHELLKSHGIDNSAAAAEQVPTCSAASSWRNTSRWWRTGGVGMSSVSNSGRCLRSSCCGLLTTPWANASSRWSMVWSTWLDATAHSSPMG